MQVTSSSGRQVHVWTWVPARAQPPDTRPASTLIQATSTLGSGVWVVLRDAHALKGADGRAGEGTERGHACHSAHHTHFSLRAAQAGGMWGVGGQAAWKGEGTYFQNIGLPRGSCCKCRLYIKAVIVSDLPGQPVLSCWCKALK